MRARNWDQFDKKLQVHGYKHVSLSVQKSDYAVKLYQKSGVKIMKEIGD